MTTKLAKKHRAQLRWIPEADLSKPSNPQPYYLLPATPEAYEAQVEAMAVAVFKNSSVEYWQKQRVAHKKLWRAEAELALAALGITKPTGAKGK